MDKIVIIGGGSWGSAIANILASKGISTVLYIWNHKQYEKICKSRKNEKYLKNFTFNERLEFSNSFEESIENATHIVLAVPTNAARSVMIQIKESNMEKAVLINLAKGLEEKTHLRISQVADEILPNLDFVSLSGPSHAEEVAFDIPTTVVVCSNKAEITKQVQDLFMTDTFRVYAQDDLIGVEMGGALKNIIALAAGLSDGLGFGDNTKAALMTRGMYEIQKLGLKMGAKKETFQGLSGIGDLIVTCTSLHSRNRNFGYLIGQGKSVKEAMDTVEMVVEGYKTTKAAYELSKTLNVEMPITEKLYNVLYEEEDPREAVIELMGRRSKHENEDIYFS